MKIEIEFRSIFDKTFYERIRGFLDKEADDLGEDDKDVFFFIMPDKLLKVVNSVSKRKAAIVLKLNKIGKGSDFEEIEVSIPQDDVEKAVKLFKNIGLTNSVMRSFQKRHNYLYKGVEIALKHSDVWGYHAELEIVIDNISKKEAAEKKIKEVAGELGIRIMTEEELADFTKKAEEKYKEKRG